MVQWCSLHWAKWQKSAYVSRVVAVMLLLCGTKLLKRCPETVCLCYQELNSEPVVPEGFPEWVELMNGWGHKMISAVEVELCFSMRSSYEHLIFIWLKSEIFTLLLPCTHVISCTKSAVFAGIVSEICTCADCCRDGCNWLWTSTDILHFNDGKCKNNKLLFFPADK